MERHRDPMNSLAKRDGVFRVRRLDMALTGPQSILAAQHLLGQRIGIAELHRAVEREHRHPLDFQS